MTFEKEIIASHLKKKECCDDDKTVLPTFLTEHFLFF
jgi:hypothetical protein